MSAMTVGTWNVGEDGTGKNLVTVAAMCDVLNGQEVGDRDAMLNAFLVSNPLWTLCAGVIRGSGSVRVLVNTATMGEVVSATSVLAVEPRELGPHGAGPDDSKPKVITRVDLANGATILNTHFIPSATRTKSYLGEREWKARRRHYADHVAAIIRLVGTIDGPVVLAGDFNAEPDFELLAPLRALGFDGWTAEGTHGRRAIDHVLHLTDRGLDVVGPTEVLDTDSDHAAVVVPYELEETQMTTRGFCPFATNRNIPPGSNDPAITPRVAILHVDAGNAESLYDYFKNRSGGIESHFHIKKTGEIEQYRSIYYQADANLDANDFAVSIETQGLGSGEWNDNQLASIRRLLLWLNDEAGIPLRKIQYWDGSGVGYHTLFGAPSHWTPVAKSCPGPERKVQFEQILVPWMREDDEPPEPPPHAVEIHRPLILAAINNALADIAPRRARIRADLEAFKETVQGWPDE